MSKGNDTKTTRRRFLTAAAAGGAAIAMPQVSRAQTATLKMQTSWPATDIFTEMAEAVHHPRQRHGRRPPARSTCCTAARWCIRSRCSTACMAARSTWLTP